jgi:sulfur relay protein TusB/DsrH
MQGIEYLGMNTLHLVSQMQALKPCLSRVEEGDVILLLGAGALASLRPELCFVREGLEWRVMRDALEMHEISADSLPQWLRCIDYAAFVDLAAVASRCVSWF